MPPYISHALLIFGVLLYAAAGALFFVNAAKRGAANRARAPKAPAHVPAPSKGLAANLLALGAISHFGYITAASFITHTCPVGSVHFILSFVAIFAAFAFTLARAFARHSGPRENIDSLGVVVAPLGLAFLLGTFFLDKPTVGHSLGAGFLAFHVLVNILGIAVFMLAGAAASLYLVQERRLKLKRLTRVGSLPPLDTLDRALHRFLLIGFPLLTIGIVSGTFFAYQLERGSADEVMRIVLGYATWLLVAAVLLLRTAAGWRGKRSAYGTLLGFVFAMSVLLVYVLRPTGQA
ncbi:MAG: cytochrome c biogenesis protein CcsA [Polyangiaceae bacterium]|nr:cytochrome c biogenesis protein CcsA [Polyangiaceae bacterium]